MNKSRYAAALPSGVRKSIRELGEFIACARKEKRWTQEEMARRIGVSRMTVVRMEKGAPEVAAGLYLTAAWLLGLPVLTWQTMGKERGDTVTGSILAKLKSTLPERVKKSRGKIDNDF